MNEAINDSNIIQHENVLKKELKRGSKAKRKKQESNQDKRQKRSNVQNNGHSNVQVGLENGTILSGPLPFTWYNDHDNDHMRSPIDKYFTVTSYKIISWLFCCYRLPTRAHTT